MEEAIKGIGERVWQARLNRGMSQNDLCDATGLSISFISNVERGKQSMNIRALLMISDALSVSADWLLRNNTPTSLSISAEEITKELESCTPKEREIILKLVQTIKDSIQQLRATSDK